MRVTVHDTSILIDLERADLLDLWFLLGIETHTTDFVHAELEQDRQPLLLACFEAGRIVCHETAGDGLAQVLRIRQEVGRGLSLADCSVLHLAETLGDSAVLTGDAAMRSVARERHMDVHGLLWVFDRLVESKLLPGQDAAMRLDLLMQSGSHLPTDECKHRIHSWRD